MTESNQLKRKKKKRQIFILLLIGLLITLVGLDLLLFKEPSVYIGSYRNLLTVSNGTIELIVGFGFIIGGVIKYFHRNEKEVNESQKKRKNWLKHY